MGAFWDLLASTNARNEIGRLILVDVGSLFSAISHFLQFLCNMLYISWLLQDNSSHGPHRPDLHLHGGCDDSLGVRKSALRQRQK